MAPKRDTRRSFGYIRKLPNGRYHASYAAPDMGASQQDDTDNPRINAPTRFLTKSDADEWLKAEKKKIDSGEWTSPAARAEAKRRNDMTVQELCDLWLKQAPLKASTVDSHRRELKARVNGTALAKQPITLVTRAHVKAWWAEVQEKHPNTPTSNSHGYKRLRSAFSHAVHELEILEVNPVNIRQAGTQPRSTVRDRALLTQAEVDALIDGVSDRMRGPVALLCYTGLRIGELLALTRADITGLEGGQMIVHVRRNAVRVKDEKTGKVRMMTLDSPKTEAGYRTVGIPEKIAADIREHCRKYVRKANDSLIVTTTNGKQMMDTSFRSRFNRGREAAGRADVTPHDCRRWFGTMLVTRGVSLEDARRLMGHSTTQQLMEYQRSASGYQAAAASVF